MSRIIREAKPSDIADIMQVMEAAKKIMRQSGNMHQWSDGYPSEAVITADMKRNGGFVIEGSGKIVGYFAFLPSPEMTYAKIYEGEWIDDVQPYHVVHRIASYPDAHGIFRIFNVTTFFQVLINRLYHPFFAAKVLNSSTNFQTFELLFILLPPKVRSKFVYITKK